MFYSQSGQIRQMEEVKISKKSKVGILPFVTVFEEFAELAETIFRNAERRGDLDKAYVKLIRAVFMNGKSPSRIRYIIFSHSAKTCSLFDYSYKHVYSWVKN